MPVPAIIEQVLSNYDLDLTNIETHLDTNISGLTQSAILQDDEGSLQAIYSADSVLDLDAIGRVTNRTLFAAPPSDVAALCKDAKVERIPTIPHALGFNLLIDQRLLEATELYLDTGDNDQNVLKLSNEQFRQMLGDARFGDITVQECDLQTSSLDGAEDTDQITKAIANFTQLRIKQRLEETLEFPPLPSTAQKIIKLRSDPDADIQALSAIVEEDPTLAAQVVSWAASPYYAAPGKIKSVHDAIMRVLGFDLVLNLALGLSLGKTLNLPQDNPKGFTGYWQQAIYTATAVETLVAAIPAKERPTLGLAYLSGLLHNFGYLVLAEVFPPHFVKYCRLQEANQYSNHCYLERHLLGVTREQMGAWLMRSWNMPEEVCNALRFQNDAEFNEEDTAYANLIFIAKRLLRKHGIGEAPLEAIPKTMYEGLNLDPGEAEIAIEKMMEAVTELDMMASNMEA